MLLSASGSVPHDIDILTGLDVADRCSDPMRWLDDYFYGPKNVEGWHQVLTQMSARGRVNTRWMQVVDLPTLQAFDLMLGNDDAQPIRDFQRL